MSETNPEPEWTHIDVLRNNNMMPKAPTPTLKIGLWRPSINQSTELAYCKYTKFADGVHWLDESDSAVAEIEAHFRSKFEAERLARFVECDMCDDGILTGLLGRPKCSYCKGSGKVEGVGE